MWKKSVALVAVVLCVASLLGVSQSTRVAVHVSDLPYGALRAYLTAGYVALSRDANLAIARAVLSVEQEDSESFRVCQCRCCRCCCCR